MSIKLKSLLYDELYEESNYALFAIDYVDEAEELEVLLDSKNPTLVLKILSRLKELGNLSDLHKKSALKVINAEDLRQYINAL